MKIYFWDKIKSDIVSGNLISDFKNGSGISIGSFDGLHQGHRFLISTLVQNCKKNNILSGVLSFSRPLPSYKHYQDYQGDLTTLEQRIKLFEQLGLDFLIIVDFTKEFSEIKGIDFLDFLHKSFNMKYIAEGVDFRCGYKGSTDISSIKYFSDNNHISYDFLDPVIYRPGTDEEERISSSYIRTMILKRFFSTAQELLERPYSIQFKIENEIKKQNETLFFEKAKFEQVLPPIGFYHCKSFDKEVRLEITETQVICQFFDDINLKLGSIITVEF